uniref:Transposase Tc1-like domain-containing protein n=1 Tax=Fundulus heteroclitus TaxID=8078 RepID=A0A3Q2UHF8_FUNHE
MKKDSNTRDVNETKERIIKLLKDGKSSRNVAKDVGCSQSAVSKIWTKYKRHWKVVKGKHTGRPRKTSQRQDRKLKAICLKNQKFTTKQMYEWEETGVNVCDRTVRNRLKEMGFTYRKAKRKPSLTPKQKKTRLQWAKEKQSWTVDEWMKVIFMDLSWTGWRLFISCHRFSASFVILQLVQVLSNGGALARTCLWAWVVELGVVKEQRSA